SDQISDSKSRPEILQAILDIAAAIDSGRTRHVEHAVCRVFKIWDQESSRPICRNGLRKVNLPTQSVVGGKARRYSPGVLPVKEPSVLAFPGIRGGRISWVDIETVEGGDGAQKKSC